MMSDARRVRCIVSAAGVVAWTAGQSHLAVHCGLIVCVRPNIFHLLLSSFNKYNARGDGLAPPCALSMSLPLACPMLLVAEGGAGGVRLVGPGYTA